MHSFDFGQKFNKNETKYMSKVDKSMQPQITNNTNNDNEPDSMLKRIKEL